MRCLLSTLSTTHEIYFTTLKCILTTLLSVHIKMDDVVTIMSRDSTMEAVSDGLYVSPAIETADYHASLNKNSWFYVFDYQAKYGDYTTVGWSLE